MYQQQVGPYIFTCAQHIQSSIYFMHLNIGLIRVIYRLYIEFSSNILGLKIHGSWHTLSHAHPMKSFIALPRLTIGVLIQSHI
jgi:hypothetical protein